MVTTRPCTQYKTSRTHQIKGPGKKGKKEEKKGKNRPLGYSMREFLGRSEDSYCPVQTQLSSVRPPFVWQSIIHQLIEAARHLVAWSLWHRWEAIPKTLYEKDFLSVWLWRGVYGFLLFSQTQCLYYVLSCYQISILVSSQYASLRVRSFSFPGSTPVCVAVFFPGRTWVIIKKTPHTGVDPGELNERTLNIHA